MSQSEEKTREGLVINYTQDRHKYTYIRVSESSNHCRKTNSHKTVI